MMTHVMKRLEVQGAEMMDYTNESLSKAVADRLHIHATQGYGVIDETGTCQLNVEWLVEDTKRMAELAFEYGCLPLQVQLENKSFLYINIATKVFSKEHPSKLHAWRWAIALALLEIEI